MTLSLFKYLPQARTDLLDTLCLRYSQPVVFNDPFEAKPYFAGIASEALGGKPTARPNPSSRESTINQRFALGSLVANPNCLNRTRLTCR